MNTVYVLEKLNWGYSTLIAVYPTEEAALTEGIRLHREEIDKRLADGWDPDDAESTPNNYEVTGVPFRGRLPGQLDAVLGSSQGAANTVG